MNRSGDQSSQDTLIEFDSDLRLHRMVSVQVASLSLMSYSEDPDYVERRIETIQGKVAGCSLGDDQFPNVSIDAPPDEGMGFQDADGASYVQERLLGSLR